MSGLVMELELRSDFELALVMQLVQALEPDSNLASVQPLLLHLYSTQACYLT